MAGGHLKSLQKYIPKPGLTCSTPTYAKGLDHLGLKRSPKKNTHLYIGIAQTAQPIIYDTVYEVHNLYIVHVLSLMAQVNVKNNACPLSYSAVLHSLKLTIYNNNFHCTLVFPSFFHY